MTSCTFTFNTVPGGLYIHSVLTNIISSRITSHRTAPPTMAVQVHGSMEHSLQWSLPGMDEYVCASSSYTTGHTAGNTEQYGHNNSIFMATVVYLSVMLTH